jgi:hypothetical protein
MAEIDTISKPLLSPNDRACSSDSKLYRLWDKIADIMNVETPRLGLRMKTYTRFILSSRFKTLRNGHDPASDNEEINEEGMVSYVSADPPQLPEMRELLGELEWKKEEEDLLMSLLPG